MKLILTHATCGEPLTFRHFGYGKCEKCEMEGVFYTVYKNDNAIIPFEYHDFLKLIEKKLTLGIDISMIKELVATLNAMIKLRE